MGGHIGGPPENPGIGGPYGTVWYPVLGGRTGGIFMEIWCEGVAMVTVEKSGIGMDFIEVSGTV